MRSKPGSTRSHCASSLGSTTVIEAKLGNTSVSRPAKCGFDLPTRVRCFELAARYVAKDIVDGAVTPQEGCARIYDLYVGGGWLESLAPWSGLDDMLALARDGICGTTEEAEAEIVAEAKRMTFPYLDRLRGLRRKE